MAAVGQTYLGVDSLYAFQVDLCSGFLKKIYNES